MMLIGANTEPIIYKNCSNQWIGTKIAMTVPMIQVTIAMVFSISLVVILSALTPAEYTSRYVVVTVENIMIIKANTPSPALTMIFPISLSPVNIAALIPIIYIQQLVMKYTTTLTMVVFLGLTTTMASLQITQPLRQNVFPKGAAKVPVRISAIDTAAPNQISPLENTEVFSCSIINLLSLNRATKNINFFNS